MHNVKQVKQGGCPRNPLTPAWHRRRPNLPVAPALPATLRWPELDHASPSHGRPLGVSGARCAHMWPGWVPAAGDGASAGPGSDRSDVQEQLEQLAGEEAQPSFGNLPLELRLKCLASCDWQTLSRAACVSRSARALVSGRPRCRRRRGPLVRSLIRPIAAAPDCPPSCARMCMARARSEPAVAALRCAGVLPDAHALLAVACGGAARGALHRLCHRRGAGAGLLQMGGERGAGQGALRVSCSRGAAACTPRRLPVQPAPQLTPSPHPMGCAGRAHAAAVRARQARHLLRVCVCKEVRGGWRAAAGTMHASPLGWDPIAIAPPNASARPHAAPCLPAATRTCRSCCARCVPT